MRFRSWVAVLGFMCGSACDSKPKRDFSRFIVKVESFGGVNVTVAGRPIPLAPREGEPTKYEGLVDFKESEVSSKTRPEVTLATPCGPKPLELKPSVLAPPNESNVVILTLSRFDLPKGTTFVFAPSVKGPVTIGDITVPTPIPRTMTVFDAGCGKPITVGAESSEIEGGNSVMVVAPSTSACLKTGVALFGTGTGCEPDSSQRLTGKLVYSMATLPQRLFEGVEYSIKTTGRCTNVSWLQEC